MNWLKKHPIFLLCIFTALMLLPNLDVLNVSIMEARNFITAREMITDGHWLLTTMNGEARYQKPPLPTWITAISSMLFGIKSVFGLRLPTVLMVMLTGTYIYKLSFEILKNSTHSFFNALIVVTSFYVIGITIEAPWDIFSHSFMLIAIFYLFKLFQKKIPSWKDGILAGIFIGFSFMSKGPISIYALLLPFLISYGFTFKYKSLNKKTPLYLAIILISLGIGGWWFIYVRLHDPLTFQIITQKETANWSNYNVKPFYYYWSFFSQSGIWTIPAFISLLFPYLKDRVRNKKGYLFSLLWTIFAVILLSIIPEKKARYLMPVLIPLAINIGFYIDYLIRNFNYLNNKKETIPVYINFGLIALIGVLFPFFGYFFLRTSPPNSWVPFIIASFILFIIGILIIYYLIKKNIKFVFLLTIAFFASILITGLPIYQSIPNTTYKPVSNEITNQVKTYTIGSIAPEIIWQFDDKLLPLKSKKNSFIYPNEEIFGVLTNAKELKKEKQLNSRYKIKIVSTFNLNLVQPNSKKYKDRLVYNFYLLEKKM